MLISKAFLKGVPTGIARSNSLSRALPLPVRPRLSSHTPPTSLAIQCLRHKSNRQGPRYPNQSNNPSSPGSRGPLSPRDLQYTPNSRSSRRAGSPAAEAEGLDIPTEETVQSDAGARLGRNAASERQPGLGEIEQEPVIGRSQASIEYPSHTPEAEEVPTLKPLPDLRHGIPSTFAEEFLKQKAGSESTEAAGEPGRERAKETGEPEEGTSGGREEGELPKSAYQTSIDKRRERMATWSYIGFGLMGVTGALFLGRNWETEEEERAHMTDAPSGWGFSLFWDRVKARLSGQMGYYTEPTFPKLLPDIDPAPPYTLVLSLEDLMIHSEWTREHGWRTAKRPGVDYFLGYLSQYYELVLFTSLPVSAADQIVRKLDPYHFMTFPLFREATRYEKGQYVKDLSYLNRPLSKTILIDTKAEHAKAQPENAIILKPWKGESGDKELVSLLPFLEQIAAMQIPDVRAALKSYEGKHIPTEFALREAKAREEFNRQFEEEQAKKPKRSGLSWLNGALGMKPQPAGMTFDGQHSVAEGLAAGKMLADQIRETGIKRYRELEKEIRENGEKWLKEEAEMEKKMLQEQMKSMKSGALSFWGGGGKNE